MERVIVDSQMRAKLRNLDLSLELCDESGRIIGYFTPAHDPRLECPFSEEELQRSSQETETYSTAEVLARLEKS